jgi:phospholipid/cholesterol/gamma-HCH transport system substrate-binding protein
MSLEAKVGAFVASGLIILFLLSTQVNDLGSINEAGKRINAYIEDASGLELKGKVKLNGVEVGYIDDISLVDHKVKLRFFIQEGIDIPVDSTVMVTQDTVLGGKLINISIGHSTEYLSEEGSLSQVGRLSSFEETSDTVDKAAEEVRLFMLELREVIAENRQNLSGALENFKAMGAEFTQTGKTVNEKLPDIMKQIDSLTKRFDSVGGTLDAQLPVAMDKFISLEDNISGILQDNKKPLNSALVSADEFFTSGESAFKKVDKLLSNFTKSELQFGMNAHYMLSDEYVKTHVDINYLPDPSTYYMLSVISMDDYTQTDTSGNYREPTTHDSGKFRFSAQYGKRYDDFLFRAGLIESTGGFGVDYFAMKDKLKWTFEAYDFNAENDLRDDSTHLKLGMRYRFLKHLEMYVGWDNFLNSKADNVYLGFGASFTEDSMKYLLGTAGAAL